MPPTTSPSPSSSTSPRRSSGPSETTATSRSVTGVPSLLTRSGYALEIGRLRDQAAAADHLLVSGDLEHAAAGVLVRRAHGGHHLRERDAERAQPVRIDLHLVLAHEAADRGDFGHARHARERVAQVPVLEAAQLGEVETAAAIDERVLDRPSPRRSRRVRASA